MTYQERRELRKKPYPTLDKVLKQLKNPKPFERNKDFLARVEELPEDPYGGVNVESLYVSNYVYEISKFGQI